MTNSARASRTRSVVWIACGAAVALAAGHGAELVGWRRPALPDDLIARPCPPGQGCHQTWTLATRLGDILEHYEGLLGPRNPRFRLLGIEFTSQPRPALRYADFGAGTNGIVIQLTLGAARDPERALFQLAHEAFHLLEPIAPESRASTLEEGLATWFADAHLSFRNLAADSVRHLTEISYRDAHALVTRLAADHADFAARVRALRQQAGAFSGLTARDIQAAFPGTPADLAHQLAEPFPAPAGQR